MKRPLPRPFVLSVLYACPIAASALLIQLGYLAGHSPTGVWGNICVFVPFFVGLGLVRRYVVGPWWSRGLVMLGFAAVYLLAYFCVGSLMAAANGDGL